MKPRILFLVPADYDALCKKGVDGMIQERDEDGFFERVVTVHPLAGRSRVIDINPVHRIYEFAVGHGVMALPGLFNVFRRGVNIAKAEGIDVVRANDPYLMGLIGWWIARRMKVPFCISIHTDYSKVFSLNRKNRVGRWRRGIASLLPMLMLRRADMVLAIREHLVPGLVACGARPSAIRIIPHGINLRPFAAPSRLARRTLGVPDGVRVISVVCRLSAENYIADIARVIARVAAERADVMFVIFGEGPEERVVRDMLAAMPSIAAAVHLRPFQPNADVVALRRDSDVALCLMGGFSLIEACAAGAPVVAYDVAWHHELVRNGETGWLVREGDVDGVVEAIYRLLDDPAAAKAQGLRGRQLVIERHDIERTSAVKRRWYAELLAGSQPT